MQKLNWLDAESVVDASTTGATLAVVGQKALGFAVPPLLYPRSSLSCEVTRYKIPLGLSLISAPEAVMWLPVDPLISVDGGNTVIKREIANSVMRGTVKELWRQDDWQVTIAGVLQSDDVMTSDEYLAQLLSMVNAREALKVSCDTLNCVYGIQTLVMDSYSFPATQGEDNQQFTLKCVSDESYNLVI
jgi:hypothetical protein